MNFTDRVKSVEPSATFAIAARAKEVEKEGKRVINFAAGEPDFDTPNFIKERAITAIKQGRTKYTPVSGIEELKKAIVYKFKNDNNLNYDPFQILVSTGAKQCLYNFFQAVCQEGDEVIIPSPYWVSYPELVKLCSAIPIIVPTQKDNNFKINLSLLKPYLSAKTKVIILNSPVNPTGAVYSLSELNEIADIAVERNIYIVSDEIYEKLIYEKEHISIASLNPDVYKLTIVINGVSKAYAMTGWRIGYAAGAQEIIAKMSIVQSHSTSCPNSIAQYAALAALKDSDYPQQILSEFEKRRNYAVDRLKGIGVSYAEPEGAFYLFCELNSKLDSKTFALRLLEKEAVAVIPGVAFGKEGWFRISFATSLENIKEGMERLGRFICGKDNR